MADLNLDLSSIKPLIAQLGLGQAPPPPPKMDALPLPPMPPPPTPAQAGFSLWSADPKNQQTIANSLTMPGTPITPANLPPASPLSGNPTPPPPDPNIKPLGTSQFAPLPPMAAPPPQLPASTPPNFSLDTKMNADMANNPDLYQKPMLKHAGFVGNLLNFGAAGLMGAAGGLKGNPNAGADWIASQAAIDRNVPAANLAEYNARNVQPLEEAAKLADTNSQVAQRTADANKKDTQADDMKPFVLSPAQAAAINHPELSGTTATMRDYSRLVGMAGNNDTSAGNNAGTNAAKVSTNAATNATRVSTNAATNAMKVSTNAATNATRRATAKSGGAGAGTPGQNDPLVQAIIEGRAPAPNARTAAGMALMRAVTAADPTYDQSRYNTYQAMQLEMTKGKTGQAINSLNTIQEHIGRAMQNMPDNTGSSALNYVKNSASEAFGGNPTGKYEVDATGIGGEWAKLVAGGVASEGEQQHVQRLLSPNASPQKMKDNLAEVKAMTDGKLVGIQRQIASAKASGPGNPATSLPSGVQQSAGEGIPAAAAAQLQEGAQHTFNNGQVWTKTNGQPVRVK
jgi:hypothetical protein